MSEVVWRARALADVERLHAFLRPKDADAAMRAAQTILQGARLLKESPRAGRPMDDDTGRRELVVPFAGGAYVLRYRIAGPGTVVVLRVCQGPGKREQLGIGQAGTP